MGKMEAAIEHVELRRELNVAPPHSVGQMHFSHCDCKRRACLGKGVFPFH